MPRTLAIAAALTILGIFALFAGDGLFAYFTPDDMMNLYDSWFRPLSDTDRPLGMLLYRGLFAVAGFNPLPYRIVCTLLLLVNLALLYVFCLRLSNSREIAALACLLGAYHAHLADLYYSTGTIYDLLCTAFYLGAFLASSRPLLFLLLYAGALASKEMAVTLPAIVLICGWVARPSGSPCRMRPGGSRYSLIPAALLTIGFIVYKIAGPRKMLANPDYLPHFTWFAFTGVWRHYAFDLFYGKIAFTPLRIMLLWATLVGIAALLHKRVLWIAFAYIFVTMLPVAFIPPRGFFAIYLTLPGWYLFIAAAIVSARDAITVPRPALQAATFAALALVLIPLHARQKPLGRQWVAEAHQSVRTIATDLRTIAGPLPRAAKILFVSDPYPTDEWMLTFIFRLYYRDPDLRVDRARAMRTPPNESDYDRLFSTDGRTLTVVR